MVYRLLVKSSWQFYRRHPAQLLLSILGILLGVGIVTAVLITNSSSQRAFALSSEALYGRTTHHISGANGLEQTEYVDLLKNFPHLSMAPVITGHLAIEDQIFSVMGIDPFAEISFKRSAWSGVGSPQLTADVETDTDSPVSPSILNTVITRNALLISDTSARELALALPATVELSVNGRLHPVEIADTFTTDNPAATTGLLLGDIAFVQSLLAKGSKIDRIDLILDEQQTQLLQNAIGSKLRLVPAAARTQTMQAMTRGFHINLTAMSLLALVVGAFLIHNTMTFAVVQRREVFAVKRVTGITSRMLLLSILAEAFLISLIGSLMGILLGYVLSGALIQLTTRTINDLYFVLHVQQIWFSPQVMTSGLLLGVVSSLLAASLSAIDAASTSPVQARQRSLQETRTRSALPWIAGIGLICSLLGIALAMAPSQSLLLGFVALMLIILGYGLIIPWVVHALSRAAKPLLDHLGVVASLAVGSIYRNISRTGLAIAALAIAVSATFGVDIMIGSFRASVDQWLGATLQSDIYVTSPSTVTTQPSPMLDPDVVAGVKTTPGIRSMSTGRSIHAATSVGSIDMLIVEPHEKSNAGFELIHSLTDNPWPEWAEEQRVMVSEPLATKHQLTPGAEISIFTENAGYRQFTISAVYRDYGSSHGKLLMSRRTFDQHWNDDSVSTLGIVLEDQSEHEQMTQLISNRFSTPEQPLLVQSNTRIHDQSLSVFDQTFEVTRVLRWLTVGVAFVGVFSALLALYLERAREFAILRASGATRRVVAMIVFAKTLVMGLLAGLLALPLGWLMSEVLIKVINMRSFGWSMGSQIPTGSVSESLLLACIAAVLAGVYPAYRLSRTDIASQLRDQ